MFICRWLGFFLIDVLRLIGLKKNFFLLQYPYIPNELDLIKDSQFHVSLRSTHVKLSTLKDGTIGLL